MRSKIWSMFTGLLMLAKILALEARDKGLRKTLVAIRTGEFGGINPSRTIVLLIMAFVVIMFILSFVPELETAVTGSTIDNDFVNSFLGIMVWVLPIGALIAILVAIFRNTTGSSRG